MGVLLSTEKNTSMERQCYSIGEKPCYNCKNGKQCFYKKSEDGDQCALCLQSTSYSCYERCATCPNLICLQCDWNELWGLCSHCDREEIHRKHFCLYCRKYNGKCRIYWCDTCEEEEHQSCLDCHLYSIPCSYQESDDDDDEEEEEEDEDHDVIIS